MYKPDVTRVQFNLLDCHDTPRFLTCAGHDIASLQLALTFIFTYPGTPCIFYGDEIGLTGRQDPECRQPFPWDEAQWNHNLRDFVKKLAKLRKTYKTLRVGSYKSLFASDGVYAFERRSTDDAYVIALNSSEDGHTLDINGVGSSSGMSKKLFGQAEFKTMNKNIQLTLPPRCGVVIQV
jgi:alpha-glucosidase